MERWRRPAFAPAAFALALVLALSACSDGSSGDAQPSASTTAPGPAGAAPDASACQTFRGAVGTRTATGPTAPGLLIDATAGGVGCLDRVEFTFRSLGDSTVSGQGLAPGYTVEYVDGPKFMDGAVAISIQGEAFLKVTMKPASSYEPTTDPNAKPKPTYLGNLSLRWTEFNHLQVVRRLEDVGDTMLWVISLDSKRAFVVDAARDPTRITIWIG